MVGARTLTALVGIVGSLALSVLLYAYTGWLVFFLLVPFVPFLFTSGRRSKPVDRPPVRECSRCGFRTRDPEFEYCPRDGTRLYEDGDY